jgi:hypothetical protein
LVEYRERHELVRLQVLLTKADLPKGKRQLSVTDIMAFPWDAPNKSNELDPDAIREKFKAARDGWGMKLSPTIEKFVEGAKSNDTSPPEGVAAR